MNNLFNWNYLHNRNLTFTQSSIQSFSFTNQFKIQKMSRICPITGKKPSRGHHVSHSQRKVKRSWKPNLIVKKVYDAVTGRMVRMKISTTALRTLTKYMGGAK